MSRPIDQAVLSLIPTHHGDAPRQLVELASSLLAQSRLRASTLKAEEEIARPYACAHIACDRLKMSLNLPPIDPRPPIPPRIYKRLYSHLDKILPNASLGTPKPRRVASTAGTPASAPRPLPSRAMPSKEKSLAAFRPSGSKGRSSQANGAPMSDGTDSALPPWVRPVARHLCKALSNEQLIPTVLAGMETIAAPHGRRSRDAWIGGNMPGLLTAVYFFAAKQLAMAAGEAELEPEQFKAMEKAIVGALKNVKKEVAVRDTDEEEAWEGWTGLERRAFREAVLEVSERGWTDGEWFQALKEVETGGLDEEVPVGVENDEAAQMTRADTMFQDKYDYLSERKRAEYRLWKEKILRRIDAMEKHRPDVMEMDS